MKYIVAIVIILAGIFAPIPAQASTTYYSHATKCGVYHGQSRVCLTTYGTQAYRGAPVLHVYKAKACVDGDLSYYEKTAADVFGIGYTTYNRHLESPGYYIFPNGVSRDKRCAVKSMNFNTRGRLFVSFSWKMYLNFARDQEGRVYYARIR